MVTSRVSIESFRMNTSIRAGSKHCNKQEMRPRSGTRTTTRSALIAALEEFHLLSSPTFIASVKPMNVNPSIQNLINLNPDSQRMSGIAKRSSLWALDFTRDTFYDGRLFRTLNVIDEGNREALRNECGTSIRSARLVRAMDHLIKV